MEPGDSILITMEEYRAVYKSATRRHMPHTVRLERGGYRFWKL